MISKIHDNDEADLVLLFKESTKKMETSNLRLAIPFSSLIEKKSPPDIYDGTESIPFEKRDPLFKSIMRKEFSNALKEFNKTILSLNKTCSF
ncbi:MAG: hypothetical protein EU539_00580 [Promethearchaeota archaeon]|nr:MAG: hypothetical protein EU539_00580 [Candidatus Lokiarchaeota archaeon]